MKSVISRSIGSMTFLLGLFMAFDVSGSVASRICAINRAKNLRKLKSIKRSIVELDSANKGDSYSDWNNIGNDIRKAMRVVEHEQHS